MYSITNKQNELTKGEEIKYSYLAEIYNHLPSEFKFLSFIEIRLA